MLRLAWVLQMNEQEYIAKEKLLVELEYHLIEEFILLRKEKNITQEELAKQSKIIRATVNRVERSLTSPKLQTILRLLEPLGYTLKIVPLDEIKEGEGGK